MDSEYQDRSIISEDRVSRNYLLIQEEHVETHQLSSFLSIPSLPEPENTHLSRVWTTSRLQVSKKRGWICHCKIWSFRKSRIWDLLEGCNFHRSEETYIVYRFGRLPLIIMIMIKWQRVGLMLMMCLKGCEIKRVAVTDEIAGGKRGTMEELWEGVSDRVLRGRESPNQYGPDEFFCSKGP